MSTQNTEDFKDHVQQANDTMARAVDEMQSRARTAFERGNEAVGEMSDLARGNVDAFVESGKILATGMQELGRGYAEEAKGAYEQATADLKDMAAIKSPTELFQIQSRIMRRNFDTLVATSSKNTETMMKLASDAFAPISGRINVAAEKMTKVV